MKNVDFCTHIHNLKNIEEEKSRLLQSMDESGVDLSVLLSISFEKGIEHTKNKMIFLHPFVRNNNERTE